jgi:rRNA-processing protein FCF1
VKKSPEEFPKTNSYSLAYLDTNALWESQWPHVSTSLKNLLILCAAAKIKVCLPEAVVLEIEQRSIRELKKAVTKFENEIFQVPEVIRRGTRVESNPLDVLLEEFHKLTDKNVSIYHIERVPLTTQTLRQFFDLAIRHTPPFANKGAGFQDSVILHSVLEHFMPLNKSKGGKLNAVITTEDSQFREGINVSGAGRLTGITVEKLVSQLQEVAPLAEATRHLWDSEIKAACKALEPMKEEVAQFVAVNYFSGFARLVVLHSRQLESVHVQRITGVTVPIPESDDAARTKNVEFSFKAEVDVETSTVQTSTVQMPSRFDMEQFDFPRIVMSERITFEIGATAKVENGEYKDIQFLNVRRP